MRIRYWLRTKTKLVHQCTMLVGLVTEARDAAVDLTAERDDALERLAMATRDRDQAWCDLAFERAPAGLPSLPASERAELLLLRDTNRDLESRLHILQMANMSAGV